MSHFWTGTRCTFGPPFTHQQFTGDNQWAITGRQATSPGKFVRSMFSARAIQRLRIKDHEFAELATAVKHSELEGQLHYEIASFEKAYDHKRYLNNHPDSCMWGEPVGEFYRSFGADCLVCVDGNGKYRARAVVWRNVKAEGITHRITFMDRVYSDSPEVEEGMKQYAREQGWYHKRNQSSGNLSSVIGPDGDCRILSMSVEGSPDADFYSYCDTFASGEEDSLQNDENGYYLYRNTDGCRQTREEEGKVETIDGDLIDEDEAVSINGDYYHQDDDRICYSEACGRSLLREDACYVEGADDWYPDGDHRVVYSEPESRYLLKRSAVRVNDDWYSGDSEDIVYSEPHAAYILVDDSVLIDGQYWYINSD